MNTEEFGIWLDAFINYERNAHKDEDNLKKMRKFAQVFGNPQDDFLSVHIAGSKGKGSVSTMIASILKEAGKKTGLYTSPHVSDFRERMTQAGSFFDDEAYSSAYRKIVKGFEEIIKKEPEIDPGWFEIVTVTAFLLFSMQKTDWAVIETGMGGRLDMTNILKPRACILTPIELEHTQYLGDTIEKIAFEKAGIIKQNTPVFCCKQPDEALRVFKKRAAELNAEFFYIPETVKEPVSCNLSKAGLKIDINFQDSHYFSKLFKRPISANLKLLDCIQAENAALAACTVKYLFPEMDEAVIERGLSRAWLPARFELLSDKPEIIIDGAHTKNSIGLCMSTYTALVKEKGSLIFACAEDKNVKDMVPFFKNHFTKIVVTIPGTAKKSNPDLSYKAVLEALKGSPCTVEKNEDYEEAIKNEIIECRKKNRPILITGSFYLAAEAKRIHTLLDPQA
ncbi:bifunctional folylpolyglutamate synthase/dihydrofolate synthase [Treponema sp. OMZ 787]|uniref:bifunctional folylpolyglutamate synthase/dihydrofolate synthase n=1 Tax=Treponema sp. OMZ 787 TaxID=2563669 RepID=UPI0020A3A167|nr:folylpolyglutamate synthase/dihydrofolate synthase family protein [Treponema sp. OMZ 787]UTC63314.1 bifunctional folylpolyglutamate synthase/dihydrofolate synthase [Treponema sp. OMZ 787]